MGAKQSSEPASHRDPWFAVGKPTEGRRATVLMLCSFALPLAIWCIAAYGPFWPTKAIITIASDTNDKENFAGTISPEESMALDRFALYQQSVRNGNAAIEEGGLTNARGGRTLIRANIKTLRSIVPVAAKAGWLDHSTMKDDAKIYDLWRKIAVGEIAVAEALSAENVLVVKRNWTMMNSASSTYASDQFIDDRPLLLLVPQAEKRPGRPVYLPAPHEVVAKALSDFRGESELGDLDVWSRYAVSIRTIVSGFLIACLIGVPLALLCGTFSFFSRLLEPFVDFFRYMPAPAFGTLLIALFGIQSAPKIALVIIGTLPQLILMVANTTRMIDLSLLDAAQTLGAKRSQLITKVVIPGILPVLYNDLRILLGWAWTWLVIAELLGTKAGLTEIIDTHGRRFHFDHVYPIILLIGFTGFVTDQILASVRGVFFPWTPEAGDSGLRKAVTGFLDWIRPNYVTETPQEEMDTANAVEPIVAHTTTP